MLLNTYIVQQKMQNANIYILFIYQINTYFCNFNLTYLNKYLEFRLTAELW